MEPLPRDFGRYRLVQLIATGGMAYVYRATLTTSAGLTKELVIKKILPHLARNRQFIDMFIDEARITMPMNHGNIVQVYEFGQVEDDYYLAMEYVRGRNLETVLERLRADGRQMPVELALYVAAEVARALDYAHRFRDERDRPFGIIHRDVSPQNVLVGFHGEVKLTDFGIAKARSRIHETAQGIIRGKACYLSPEQAECRELDGRSDIFSLGVVFFEMLTGKRPFEGENEVATLDLVRQARPVSPVQYRPELSTRVEGIAMKALHREPERRFQTAGQMQRALELALHEQAPECNAATLAGWMRELFAEEQNGNGEDVKNDGGFDASLPTVDIRSTSDERTAAPTGSKTSATAIVLFMLLAAAALAWFVLRNAQPEAPSSEKAERGATPEPDAGRVASPGGGPQMLSVVSPDGGPALAGGDGEAEADEAVRNGSADEDHAIPHENRTARIGYGWLDVNAYPWAHVWLDGRKLDGETPIMKLKVRAGWHRLRFFNPSLNIEKIRRVKVSPGQTVAVIEKLAEP